MSKDFQKFPSIESFAHAHRHMAKKMAPSDSIYIRPKIKLHGTNGGVRIDLDQGTVAAQSRNRNIFVGDDNAGFAAFVEEQRDEWLSLNETLTLGSPQATFYGEWAGPGIQERDAITKIPEREFFIFAVRLGDIMISDPALIEDMVPNGLKNVRVLPWADEATQLSPFIASSAETFANHASEIAEACGEKDPYVFNTFGVEGPGEGYVYMSENIVTTETFRLYTFKVKCEAHRVKKAKKAATVKFMVPENVTAFLDTFVTEQRLMQGVTEACDGEFDKTRTSDFLKWMGNDVRKESEVELEEMGFEWKQVAKHVNQTAVKWWINKCDTVVVAEQKEAA